MSEREDVRELERRLQRSWLAQGEPELDARWKAGVMASVRERALGPDAPRTDVFGRVARRALLFASLAAAAAVAVFVFRFGSLDPQAALARLLSSDPQSWIEIALLYG